MTDTVIGWMLQCIEGDIEVLSKAITAADKIDGDKFQRLVKLAQSLTGVAKAGQGKST